MFITGFACFSPFTTKKEHHNTYFAKTQCSNIYSQQAPHSRLVNTL